MARSIEPQGILFGALDGGDYKNLVWLDRSDEPPNPVIEALARWRPLLKSRAEFKRNAARRWWECAWPRDKELMRSPKVIGLHRTDRGRFAVDPSGEWQSGKGGVIVTASIRGGRMTELYLLAGYLNSELLDLWYSIRGRTPRDVWRDYEPKPMGRIPYRHVDLSTKGQTARLKNLEAVLARGDVEGATSLGADIGLDLRAAGDAGLAADAPEAIEAGRALEAVVRAIADNRRALLPFRDRFPALERVVKDPWSTEVVDPAAGAFVAALPQRRRASVRVDPELSSSIDTDGVLGRSALESDSLVFKHRRNAVATVDGPREKLILLGQLAPPDGRLMPADLLAIEVPRDMGEFRRAVEEASAEVRNLIAAGRVLVEIAERLVCALYGIPRQLEDEVVAHAVARAANRGND